MTETSFQARELKKVYSGRTVVKDVSIGVNRGEVVGLLGPNGAGKTTSFYMMVGLVKADHGSITLNGEDVTKLPLHERAQKGVGYLPQEASVFRELSVEENIYSVLEIRNIFKTEKKNTLQNLIKDFGLGHIRKSKGRELSGGERRRVEIARCLALKPSFVLLDEPFAGVDPLAVSDIQKIIMDLKKRDIGVLITDHSVRETLGIDSNTIVGNKEARKFYLGEEFKL